MSEIHVLPANKDRLYPMVLCFDKRGVYQWGERHLDLKSAVRAAGWYRAKLKKKSKAIPYCMLGIPAFHQKRMLREARQWRRKSKRVLPCK